MSEATRDFVRVLEGLKAGDVGRLRGYAGRSLDESVEGFDLFAGVWWPLRERNQSAPRREVAWLVAKLYGGRPMPQMDGESLGKKLGTLARDPVRGKRIQARFDAMLGEPLNQIEPALQWCLAQLEGGVDWVQLVDELSIWERESTRRKWAYEFVENNGKQAEGEPNVN